ncbi:MAG: YdcF family protein [Magnetococcales bacterium]|nr:YdcF family protein [Magnetococcales bacterium]
MTPSLQEIAKFFVNPMLYVTLGFLLAILFAKKGSRRPIVLLFLLFYLFTVPAVPVLLNRAWRVDDTIRSDKTYDAVAVLLGVTHYGWHRSTHYLGAFPDLVMLNRSADRILAGLELVKSKRAGFLLIGDLDLTFYHETQRLLLLADQLEVPRDRIIVFGPVARTLDEARGVKRVFQNHPGWNDLLLVTSQSHMRRASALFRKQRLIPDIYSVELDETELRWRHFLPSSGAPSRMKRFLYEMVGYVGYWLLDDL